MLTTLNILHTIPEPNLNAYKSKERVARRSYRQLLNQSEPRLRGRSFFPPFDTSSHPRGVFSNRYPPEHLQTVSLIIR